MKLRHSYFTRKNATFYHSHGYHDSKENFENNLKKYPNHPCLLHYKKYPIVYKTNNYGFRCPDDINEEFDGNLYIGCSHTFGIGHYWENTWVKLLNDRIGGKCLNLAVPGTGIGTGSRLLDDVKEIIKPKNIFIHYPHPYRYEYFDYKLKRWRSVSVSIQDDDPKLAEFPKDMYRFLAEENYARSYYKLHMNLIKTLAAEMKANLYSIRFIHQGLLKGEYSEIRPYPPVPLIARDMLHCNVLWQKNVADRFYKAYTNNEPLVEFPPDEEIDIENIALNRHMKKLYPKSII